MKIIQSPIFLKSVKKLHIQEKLLLDDAIKSIIKTPNIGEEKKGDLKGVFVYKFKINKTLHLLSYQYSENILYLIMLGTHENYYRDIKNYQK